MTGDRSRWELAALVLVALTNAHFAYHAPMLYCPDSMDYFTNAQLFIDHLSDGHAFDHFNAWRMPGYSLFIALLLAKAAHLNAALGWLQAALSIATAWLASRSIKPFAGGLWPTAVVLAVGLDPVLLSWSRHAMPECLCAFLMTLLGWAAVQSRLWMTRRPLIPVVFACTFGLAAAVLCYVRSNFQVALALAPLAIAAWPLMSSPSGRGRTRSATLLLAAFTAAGLCLYPWIARNETRYDRARFAMGSGYTATYSASEVGLLDRNQSGFFDSGEWSKIQSLPSPGTFEFMAALKDHASGPIAQRTASLPEWTMLDTRAAQVARESLARHPGPSRKLSLKALCNLLGLWPFAEPSFQENDYWSPQLRGRDDTGLNHPAPPQAYAHLPLTLTQPIYDRTQESTRSWSGSWQAKLFNVGYTAAAFVRPIGAVLFLIGLFVALRRRQWPLFIVGVIPLAHAAALALFLMSGIDRYQTPFIPLMTAVGIYGLAAAVGRSAQLLRSRSGAIPSLGQGQTP